MHKISSRNTGLRCVGVHVMFLTFFHPFLTIFQSVKLIPTLCSSRIVLNYLETKFPILGYAGRKMQVRVEKYKVFYVYDGLTFKLDLRNGFRPFIRSLCYSNYIIYVESVSSILHLRVIKIEAFTDVLI